MFICLSTSCRAAYKGFSDCVRLLLFLDAYRGRQDKEGMLHVTMFYSYRERSILNTIYARGKAFWACNSALIGFPILGLVRH